MAVKNEENKGKLSELDVLSQVLQKLWPILSILAVFWALAVNAPFEAHLKDYNKTNGETKEEIEKLKAQFHSLNGNVIEIGGDVKHIRKAIDKLEKER